MAVQFGRDQGLYEQISDSNKLIAKMMDLVGYKNKTTKTIIVSKVPKADLSSVNIIILCRRWVKVYILIIFWN